MKKLLLLVFVTMFMVSCTNNQKAKNFGGTAKIELDKGKKLVDVTWKENSLWYLTKPMTETDVAETYLFQEESSFGIVQGKVIFIETK